MNKTKSRKIAIVSSHNAKKTSQVAKKIMDIAPWNEVVNLDVETVNPKDLTQYDLLLLGVPSWFDGELPTYWDELVPALEEINFKGVKVAIFGNGDQVGYPENFGDAVGIMAEIMTASGAAIIGFTSTSGYNFENSRAQKNDKFCGLILDFENQVNQNNGRIKEWLKIIENDLLNGS